MLDEIESKLTKRKYRQEFIAVKGALDNAKSMVNHLTNEYLKAILTRTKNLIFQFASRTRLKDLSAKLESYLNLIKNRTNQQLGSYISRPNDQTIALMLNNLITLQLTMFSPSPRNIRITLKHQALEIAHQQLKTYSSLVSTKNEAPSLEDIANRVKCALYQHTSRLFTCGKPRSLLTCEAELEQIIQFTSASHA